MNDSSVLVVTRVRPLNGREKEKGGEICINDIDKTSLKIGGKTFAFDAVLDLKSTQEQVYGCTAKLILGKVLLGYNGCIFAYGQTGAGKTFTMEGDDHQPGITPQMCHHIFDSISKDTERSWVVTMTYLEIYQENIRDLLVEKVTPQKKGGDRRGSFGGDDAVSSGDIAIREARDGLIYVEGITEKTVKTKEAVLQLLKEGASRREKGETNMNAVSSRSHAILTLNLEQILVNDKDGYSKKVSKLNLIDLAGSERANATGATGERLKEGASINQSLSALGNVINALTESNRGHIPYRNSKLTRMLQDSLGGNAYTMMICNVSPAKINFEETTSSLRFAERAKKVQNDAKINQDPLAKKMADLIADNERLKKSLAAHKTRETQLENLIVDINKRNVGGGCCTIC